ncbi:MAG: carboxypeptidase-like regulatory domain-containing protein, partial [Phaeodactylibacter sp.]|nr:carboxypeptidase-like regulatory domain-containing protein [Phaeodactylibacter sp.]
MKNFKLLFFAVLPVLVVALFTGCKDDNPTTPVDDTIQVCGTVTDQDGNPLAGVAVSSGTSNTTTDADGKYCIDVNKDGALTFSLTDYESETKFVNNQNSIDASLVSAVSMETTYEESTVEKECDGGQTVDILQVSVTDRGEGSGTMTWTSDKVWILEGLVFVNDGQVLTIEPGTIIKGKSGQGEKAAALVVAQGGELIAEGTADMPIIFTSEADAIARDQDGNLCLGGSLASSVRGLWGGVILLGKAQINAATETRAIEGIPSTEPRGTYGGTDDGDSSGSLKYISIRHGGTDIGAGNEINGLTMGAVGNGTTIDYIEVFANKDDGYEWFGGAVNTKHLVSAFCGDDAFDYDEGWRGKNQFWLAYQEGAGDRGGEHDGGPSDCETCEPFALPVVYNASFRGQGSGEGKRAITFRDNAGGEYHNSIFWAYGRGIDIEVRASIDDSYTQFSNGNLKFTNNIMFDIAERLFSIGNEDEIDVSAEQAALDAYFNDAANNLQVVDPQLGSNLAPMTGGPAAQAGADVPNDGFFEAAPYHGAFAPGVETWISGWTAIS